MRLKGIVLFAFVIVYKEFQKFTAILKKKFININKKTLSLPKKHDNYGTKRFFSQTSRDFRAGFGQIAVSTAWIEQQ
jgi:hypothetical protein